MALSLPVSSQKDKHTIFLNSNFLPLNPQWIPYTINRNDSKNRKPKNLSISVSCSSLKIVRSPSLDKNIVKQNKLRFIQKLKTLLLSKPKHYMPIHILSKCRSYLSLSKPRSLLSMIYRYPSIFELFRIPTPPTPFNATKSCTQLCVRLTPAAASLAAQECNLKSAMSVTLATKLQKLLMLSSHRRLLLTKLVHLAPDLGLPPNFRSRLCNDHPDKFKTVDTSYGRALELVSWDPHLANPLPSPEVQSLGLIVDRPLKFKHLRLRKGLNLKRRHRDFLIKLQELPDVCPYKTSVGEFPKESIEAEKRACGVVREVLGMMVEKRTLVDHLTHFRKDFGLPNKLRGMLVRHPELFYVSLKGERDSVFLVEGYNDKGTLLEKDETSVIKEQLMGLVREGKKMRRERRNQSINNEVGGYDDTIDDHIDDDTKDGFDSLLDFEDIDGDYEDFGSDNEEEDDEYDLSRVGVNFWTADAHVVNDEEKGPSEPW
ncbi:protein WHAT'S THIS FACTOR 1, chloroplastic [Vitis riparia]|uniref:protein WHAT'S THIS FACTOR 1, chloroplastic n=1 Tax=Vitis riparia TaxID=96939 RepID=UPI00155A9CB1|nr:protein WHAT'S THIS FACTOR 1, chloroplastic [Vitis riparia]